MSTQAASSPGDDATPVLDIGGEVGALVVYLAARPASGELEACPAAEPAARFHTGVHCRPVGDGSAWTAVFPAVSEGAYHLLDEQGGPSAQVEITGGEVGELDLR